VEREKTLLFLNADLADLAILIIHARYTAMWLIRLTVDDLKRMDGEDGQRSGNNGNDGRKLPAQDASDDGL
jgi:hypothetical protein